MARGPTEKQPAAAGGVLQRFPLLLRLLAVLLVVAGVGIYLGLNQREPTVPEIAVTLQVDGGEPILVHTRGAVVADALAAAQVAIGPHDLVEPGPDAPLEGDLVVVVRRAIPVQVRVDGEEHEVWTVADTVRGALQAAGVRIGELDRVTPRLADRLEAGLSIQVTRVVEEFVEEIEMLPFKVVRWAAPELERGQTRVIREGQEGILRKTIRMVYEDGRLAGQSIVASEVERPAVDRVIGEGTRTPALVVQTESGPLRYSEVREMTATAYYPGPRSTGEWADGLTFTGLVARRGVIAVDPTVIPLGTRLYVPGYGEGIAADIGGAIKGNIIDVLFETYEEAIQWGRQTVQVYILEP